MIGQRRGSAEPRVNVFMSGLAGQPPGRRQPATRHRTRFSGRSPRKGADDHMRRPDAAACLLRPRCPAPAVQFAGQIGLHSGPDFRATFQGFIRLSVAYSCDFPSPTSARLALAPARAPPRAWRSASPSPAPNGSPHSPPCARCAPTARRAPGACTPCAPWEACRRSPAAPDRAPPSCGRWPRCPAPSSRRRARSASRAAPAFAASSPSESGQGLTAPVASAAAAAPGAPRTTRHGDIAAGRRSLRQTLDLVDPRPRGPRGGYPQGRLQYNAARRLDRSKPAQRALLARPQAGRSPASTLFDHQQSPLSCSRQRALRALQGGECVRGSCVVPATA